MTEKICIRCGKEAANANSHVIPNSIRKKIYGEGSKQERKFSFNYIGREKFPKQDFPKPQLMCIPCDNKFGSDLEDTLPSILMPVNVDDPSAWEKLGLIQLDCSLFKKYPDKFQSILERNAALISWKIMHEVAINERDDLLEFLNSPNGKQLDSAMLQFIEKGNFEKSETEFEKPIFWKIEPHTAAAITGICDELPVTWKVFYEEGKPETASIFAAFGFWVVGWQLPQSVRPFNTSLKIFLKHLME